MRSKYVVPIICIVILLSIILVGWTSEGNAASKSEGNNDFVYAAGTEPGTLDPQFVTDVNTARAVVQIFENLVRWDENFEIVPFLAKSWEVSDDNKTWTFKLQEGVKFHDGAPFNAEAVKYNFERLFDPDVASPRKSVASMIDKVNVLGEYEVSLSTKEPFGAFLAQLTSYNLAMISPKSAKEYGKNFGTHPAGTGPLMLDEWIPAQRLVMKRFDDYWGEKSTVNKVYFKVVPEDVSRVMMLKTGDADVVIGIPPIQMESLQKDKNIKTIIKTGFRTIYIGMNLKHKPFDDIRVRHAVNYAIDKESIIKYVLNNIGKYPVGVESTVISNSSQDLVPYKYDPEKAKQLLAEAGFPNGFKTSLYTPEGRYPMDREVAEVVQSQLREVGINAEITVLDWGAYVAATNTGEDTRLFLLGKGCPSGDPDLDLTLSFGTDKKMNNSFYSNPKVDELLILEKITVDPEKRSQILYDIQKQIHEDAPWAVLYYVVQTLATRADVEGFEVYPNEMISLKYLKRK